MTFACSGCSRWVEAPKKPKRCPHCGSLRIRVPSEAAKRQTRDDAPLPRRVNGPSTDDGWLDPDKQRIREAHEPLMYLLTDEAGLRMVAAGLMPEHLSEQARRALAWVGEE